MKLSSKPRKPLPRESKKRIAEKPLRKAIVAKLLEENPNCVIGLALRELDHPQGQRCRGRSSVIHEFAQRSIFPGSHLHEELALAVCDRCHSWAHESGDPLVEELSFLVKSWNVADLVANARAETES